MGIVSWPPAYTDHPLNRSIEPMGKLFFHMGVFAVVTFLVYLACMFFVRIEDQREARRRGR